ncbi:GreA/GreB family elongation factor [Amycolatopsis sp. NPDC004378]
MTGDAGPAEELDVLRAQRRAVQAGLTGDDGPGDRADQAVTLELGDELARLDTRIGEIMRELHHPSDAGLSRGTRVRVRHPDGTEEDLRVGYPEEAESDAGGAVLTADSPLGVALIGRSAGDRITYPTPAGPQVAEVVAVWPLTSDHPSES